MIGEVQIYISGATAQALKNMSHENECDDDVIHRLIGLALPTNGAKEIIKFAAPLHNLNFSFTVKESQIMTPLARGFQQGPKMVTADIRIVEENMVHPTNSVTLVNVEALERLTEEIAALHPPMHTIVYNSEVLERARKRRIEVIIKEAE